MNLTTPALTLTLLLTLGLSATAHAVDSVAESHLVDAAIAFGEAKRSGFRPEHMETLRQALKKARQEAVSDGLKARVERQQGLYHVVTGGGSAALRCFVRAVQLAPKLKLGGKGPSATLFQCARRLAPGGWPGGKLTPLPGGGWRCPDGKDPAPAPAPLAPAGPPPAPRIGWKAITGGSLVLVGGTLALIEQLRLPGLEDRKERVAAEARASAVQGSSTSRLRPVWAVQDKIDNAKNLRFAGLGLAVVGLGLVAWDWFEPAPADAPIFAISVGPGGALVTARF